MNAEWTEADAQELARLRHRQAAAAQRRHRDQHALMDATMASSLVAGEMLDNADRVIALLTPHRKDALPSEGCAAVAPRVGP